SRVNAALDKADSELNKDGHSELGRTLRELLGQISELEETLKVAGADHLEAVTNNIKK
ncbi:MAG: hypothetical protein JWO53_981, partial [Chlamydiia bacterium]|nr:hypothetical protein [Chlamydiia bacterium]